MDGPIAAPMGMSAGKLLGMAGTLLASDMGLTKDCCCDFCKKSDVVIVAMAGLNPRPAISGDIGVIGAMEGMGGTAGPRGRGVF